MGIKISNLPAIVTPALTDVFPVVQGGVTYKETVTQLSALIGSVSVTTITGTANQIIASASTGPVTLSTPQDIGTSSAVAFGSLTFGANTTNGHIGVTGALSPATGVVGEVLSSAVVHTTASLTTGTAANVTSVTLTPGEWILSGWVFFSAGATTTSTNFACGISATSATLPSQTTPIVSEPVTALQIDYSGASAGQAPTLALANGYKKVTTNTPMYLVALSSFAVSTMTAGGVILAQRIR